MTVVMVIYLSQTTPRYKCDVTAVKVIYLSQTTQVRYKASYGMCQNGCFKEVVLMNSMEGNNDEMWFLDNDYVMEDEMGEAEEQLVDEGEHNVPFNVANVPQQLVTADAHTQREVHLGLYEQQPASGQDHVTKFKATVGLLRQWHQIMMDNTQMQVLPFNPQGQMMALGTCMDEQLWVAMAPNKYFEEGYGENREEEVPVLETKMTALSMEHRYMMIMFITQYPELLTLELIKASMEVLGRFDKWHWNIKLRLNDMKAFHRHFMNSWVEWYGQNQLIMVSQAVEEERMNWSRDRDFSYLEVQRWHKVSLERITQNHEEVYNKPEHDASRVAVDLRELDLLDNDGYEINVYNKAGWQVLRWVPKESESCGALLDLDKVHELFQGRDKVHGEMTNEVEFWVYPLAFTQKYGNMKAHGIIPNMAACVGKLNKSIFRGGMEDDDMEVDEGGEERVGLARQNLAICGIASQIYNLLLHWVQNEAKFHSVQLGMMMSALDGAGIEMSEGDRGWAAAGPTIQKHIYSGTDTDLRGVMEWVAWSHPQVLGPIKDSLKLFKADHKQDLEDKRSIDTCMIEVMSMLEQMLNFTHTGNTAVLSTRLMDWAWLLLGLLSDGFPALSDTFIAHGALSMGQVTVRWHEWPVEAETWQPMMSSKWAQQLTYGEVHYEKLTSFIADIMIKQCSKDMVHNIPPFIKGGNFIHVARVAVEEMKKAGTHAGHSGGELTGFVADVICAACEHLKINHIPWSCNPTGGAGWPSNVVVHELWLNLGGQAPPAMGSQLMNIPAQQSNSAMAYQASQAIQAGDALLHKINLPSDWVLAHIEAEGMPEYILDGYRFMQNTTVAEHLLAKESNVSIVEGAIWRIFGEAGLGGMRVEGEQAAWTIHHNGVRIYHLPDFAAAKGINVFLLAHLGLASIKMASGFQSAKWMVDIKPCGGDKIIMQHVEAV
ncbi:hypothetical protein EDC04DRAFT_2600330 [Pisolithus marmoratus]|nr:hypothetical protein EDC04DRAFT_2600330 [Pisolithus marmoratus]